MKKEKEKVDLLIYDDIFPLSSSAFRFIEFNYLLKQKNINTHLYTTGRSLKNIDKKIKLKNIVSDYLDKFPENKNKVHIYKFWKKFDTKLLYVIFINNVYDIIRKIELSKTPFVFTLYPGGGFYLNNEESDKKLKRVFSSKYFARVIVTQQIIKNYLLEKKMCPEEKIEYIYGGPFLQENFKIKKSDIKKKLYKKDKETFDICFVAHKYMPKGVDKGLDVFIEVAKKLILYNEGFRFHVVGGFNSGDADADGIEDKISYYGVLEASDFEDFFSNMDLIISPNRPNMFKSGSFDGFPTASCDIAGANQTFVLCSDELFLNKNFNDKDDLRIIKIDANEISNIVLEYFNNPDTLYEKSVKASEKFIEIFSPENQITKRIKLFNKLLN